MRLSKGLLMGVSGLALSFASAQAEQPSPAPLPQAYDLMAISRGPASVTPGLGPDKRNVPEATIISVLPAGGGEPQSKVEWSGYVKTGVIYSNSSTKTKISPRP